MNRVDVLFISHETSRTGAPMVLLHLLEWLRRNSSLRFAVLLQRGGPLLDEFRGVCETFEMHPRPLVSRYRGVRDALQQLHQRRLRRALGNMRPRLIYANSLASLPAVEMLSHLQCPLITHVHELEFYIRKLGSERFASWQRRTGTFIAASNAVRENLVQGHGIDHGRVELVHEFLPVASEPCARTATGGAETRRQYGIPEGVPLVGAIGTLGWRKGSDLFAPLAAIANRMHNRGPVHFAWLGGKSDCGPAREMLHDAEKLGIGDRVHVLGSAPNASGFLEAIDVFALLSREDPYPLVVLESASTGRPIVCFAGSGGAPEFVEDDAGFVVPYLDIDQMAGRLVELVNDPELRTRLGRNAQQKVAHRHGVDGAGGQLLNIISRYVEA